MKYVSIRMPELGPLGETLFEARVLAIVLALLVNNPAGDEWNPFSLLLSICLSFVVRILIMPVFVFVFAPVIENYFC
jgi:hypothetical protein